MVDLHSSREAGSAQGPPSATERRECKSRVTPLLRDADSGQIDHMAAEPTHGPHHPHRSPSPRRAYGDMLAIANVSLDGGSSIKCKVVAGRSGGPYPHSSTQLYDTAVYSLCTAYTCGRPLPASPHPHTHTQSTHPHTQHSAPWTYTLFCFYTCWARIACRTRVGDRHLWCCGNLGRQSP